MKFLSHRDSELLDHLKDVADEAKLTASDSKFENKKLAYYAGLFHDIGKLNSYYQKLFCKLNDEDWSDYSKKAKEYKGALAKEYDACHAPYSRHIAAQALKNALPRKDILKILMMVYCHHVSMTNMPGSWEDRKPKKTKGELGENWKQFRIDPNVIKRFDQFNLDFDIYENTRIKASAELKVEDCLGYVELGFLHSCLLQADRGYFQRRKEKNQPSTHNQKDKLNLCTKILTEKSEVNEQTSVTESQLNEHRDRFQSVVAKEIKENPVTAENPIKIINAPTGIGKTKAFLDMIDEIDVDRIFYFSPLLALTNDFEEKMEKAVCGNNKEEKEEEWKKILTYNHTYSGMLDTKIKKRENDLKGWNFDQNKTSVINDEGEKDENDLKGWNFDQESFNARFVITTMHRLLMTIYSPKSRDKLKLASFRNALLIVDEVQTLPKFLLNNLTQIFQIMGEKMGTRTILVSATIPEQIAKFPTISMKKSDVGDYLDKIERKIVLEKKFDPNLIKPGRNLVMLNTRKMAVNTFNEISNNKNQSKILYISSGIVKEKQKEIIKNIKKKIDFILVSTQVVEAGVDISFSNIWRQMAPLDNIVQIAGRLNREGKYSSSTLCIFDSDDNTPYSSLEYKVSQEYIKGRKTVKDLYDILPEYYHEINTRDNSLKNKMDSLEKYVNQLDFKYVWEMIYDCISTDYYDSVYIPDSAKWENIREDLLRDSKNVIKKHADIQAVLPISVYKIKEYFDEELFDKKIYYPKKDKIDELYDEVIGLDKWIKT